MNKVVTLSLELEQINIKVVFNLTNASIHFLLKASSRVLRALASLPSFLALSS